MKIDTTINIRKQVLKRIDAACVEYSVSRSRFVSLLLLRFMKEKATDKNRFSRVKYQKRDTKASWKRPHVMLESDLYEKCLDMRKLFKMSVSFIVAVAFTCYFDSVVYELKNDGDTDKNTRNYICIGNRYENVFSFSIFWDYPAEEILLKILE